MPTISDSGSF